MFEKMFKRRDVCDFINELFTESYNNKKKDSSIDGSNVTNTQEMLFTFFDALFKYQIIIETDVFLDDVTVKDVENELKTKVYVSTDAFSTVEILTRQEA